MHLSVGKFPFIFFCILSLIVNPFRHPMAPGVPQRPRTMAPWQVMVLGVTVIWPAALLQLKKKNTKDVQKQQQRDQREWGGALPVSEKREFIQNGTTA